MTNNLSMNMAIFGATGGTGRELVVQATSAGHKIRALTRSPDKLSQDKNITVIPGNVLDPQAVSDTVNGTDAVICLLGRNPNNPKNIVSRGTKNIIDAMDNYDIRRLVVLTSMGLGTSIRQVPWYTRLAIVTVLSGLMSDKARQEERIMTSDHDWTIVRPGGLTDGPYTGEYVHGIDIDASAAPISRADVADFLLYVVQTGTYKREIPVVTTTESVDFKFLWDQIRAVSLRLFQKSK